MAEAKTKQIKKTSSNKNSNQINKSKKRNITLNNNLSNLKTEKKTKQNQSKKNNTLSKETNKKKALKNVAIKKSGKSLKKSSVTTTSQVKKVSSKKNVSSKNSNQINKSKKETVTLNSKSIDKNQSKKNNTLSKETNNKNALKNAPIKKLVATTNPRVKNNKTNKKKLKYKCKIGQRVILGVIVIAICLVVFGVILLLPPRFKNVTIELGATYSVTLDSFLVDASYKSDSNIKTDLSKLDLSKVAEYDIILTYKNKEKKVKLKIVDTTAPKVVFKDVVEYIDYKIDADDFIEEKEDMSSMKVFVSNVNITNEFKDYIVTVSVEDEYGNITSKDCKLIITWIRPLVYIELGTSFSKSDLLLNLAKDANKISESELEKVNISKPGEYMLFATYNSEEYQSKVIIQDTKPPELTLKDVTLEFGQKIKNENSFIKSVTDASGEVTTVIKNDIDYSKLGVQDVIIEATDFYGNKITKTAILTIKKTGSGPVFSGVGALTVEKYQTIDYNKGVKAVDAKDGVMTFSVDSSLVNTSVAGTYYAEYSSIDKDGNRTVIKRKVIVLHNQDDTDEKFDEFYDKYLVGKSVLEIISIVRTKISYNHDDGGSDPIWYALNNGSGDCYVHAIFAKKALDKAGINNQLIYVKDKTHYWNLVEIDGKWRHYDSTPGNHIKGPATDNEKFKSSGMAGRDWDREAFPKAL